MWIECRGTSDMATSGKARGYLVMSKLRSDIPCKGVGQNPRKNTMGCIKDGCFCCYDVGLLHSR